MRFSRPQISWIIYDMALSAFALVVRTCFAPIFYKDYAAVDMHPETATAYWGYLSSAAGLAAAFLAPYLGTLADGRCHRKRFLFGAMVLGIVSLVAMCFVGEGAAVMMMSFYFAGMLAFMLSSSFYDSLLLDVSPKGMVNRISSISYAWGYIGGMIPFLLCLGLMAMCKDQPIMVIKVSFVITAVWWVMLSVPLFRDVRERRKPQPDFRALDGFRKLWATFCEVRKHKNVFVFLIAYFLYIDGVGTIVMMATPYGRDAGISAGMLILTILALQVIAFPFTLLYGYLTKFFAARQLIYAAIGVYVVIVLLAGYLPMVEDPTTKKAIFFVIAFLIGTSQGGIQSLSRSLFATLIPAKQSSEFFGFYNIFGKFTTILGPVLVGVAAMWLGHSGYGMAMLAVPFALGAVMLSKVKVKSS